MKKYPLSKIYDDSFKKEILDIIKQGMPEGSIYSSEAKPPEGAQVYTTDRGAEYWVPSKKDDPEGKQAKPKQAERFPSTRKRVDKIFRRALKNRIRNHSVELEDLKRRKEKVKGINKVADLKAEIQFQEEKINGYKKLLYGKTKQSIPENDPFVQQKHIVKESCNCENCFHEKSNHMGIIEKQTINPFAVATAQAKKMGYEDFSEDSAGAKKRDKIAEAIKEN